MLMELLIANEQLDNLFETEPEATPLAGKTGKMARQDQKARI